MNHFGLLFLFRELRKHLIVLLAIAPLTSIAAAGNSHQNAAEEFLELTQIQRQLDVIAQQLLIPTASRLNKLQVNEAQAEIIKGYYDEIATLLKESISWENNKDSYIKIYTQHFSEKELNEITSFLSSDVGKKYLSNTNAINKEIAALTLEMVENLNPEIQERLQEMVERLRKVTPTAEPTSNGE